MSSSRLIQATDLSKEFLIYDSPGKRLKQMLLPKVQSMFGIKQSEFFRRFPAVIDVSLNVGRGETVGIVGRNGSGKSTLLEMICGTLQPSRGSVEVNGRVAALLELGSGFNPEFTGRENIYLNAAILGLNRSEINERFDEIVAFADIGNFIEQPVKTYSSGMYVRLAFAVAINVNPDILIIDEALAVGDEAFQRKCFGKLEQIKDRGGTILFVSHSAQSVIQLCDRAILLDRGEKILEGHPKAVIDRYQRFINLSGEQAEEMREQIRAIGTEYNEQPAVQIDTDTVTGIMPSDGRKSDFHHFTSEAGDPSFFDPKLDENQPFIYERQGAEIADVGVFSNSGDRVNSIALGREYIIRYTVHFSDRAKNIKFGMVFRNMAGIELAGANNANLKNGSLTVVEPGEKVTIEFSFVCLLLPGPYTLTVGVVGSDDNGNERFLHRIVDCVQVRVLPEENVVEFGYFAMDCEFRLKKTYSDDQAA